jgi:hypothetical protein
VALMCSMRQRDTLLTGPASSCCCCPRWVPGCVWGGDGRRRVAQVVRRNAARDMADRAGQQLLRLPKVGAWVCVGRGGEAACGAGGAAGCSARHG